MMAFEQNRAQTTRSKRPAFGFFKTSTVWCAIVDELRGWDLRRKVLVYMDGKVRAIEARCPQALQGDDWSHWSASFIRVAAM